MEPWLPARGLAMVAGYRGIGKTFVAASVAYAIATGGALLGFQAPKPRRVLYLDGEMDPAELQDRFEAIHAAAKRDRNGDPSLASANLRILTHADQDLGIPDLSDPDGRGRALVESELGDA
jgi:RecA-family ATPase